MPAIARAGRIRAPRPWRSRDGRATHGLRAARFPCNQTRAVKFDLKKFEALALEEVEATLAALPAPLRERAKNLPVTFERTPNAGLRADGIAADTLGLFCGPEFAEEGDVPMPPQIILFLENLWDFAEGDTDIFLDEVDCRQASQ